MRDELGMDPIPDGEREKMFVELITRENLRVEAELNLQAQKEACNSKVLLKLITSKRIRVVSLLAELAIRNQVKDGLEPKTIGLVKDSIDNLEISIDNYIKECFATDTQVLQTKLIEKVVACNKEIMYTISRGSGD